MGHFFIPKALPNFLTFEDFDGNKARQACVHPRSGEDVHDRSVILLTEIANIAFPLFPFRSVGADK